MNRASLPERSRCQLPGVLLLLGLMLFPGAEGFGPAAAVAGQGQSPVAAAATGESRSNPAALGESVMAGDAMIAVQDVEAGEAATASVVAADPTNAPPRDGITYVLVLLSVENKGTQPLLLSNDDFALTGVSGLVRRFLWLTPPDPALPRELAPGEASEGWVVLSAPVEETTLLLLYDNLSLDGTWADRYLALNAGAAIPNTKAQIAPANEIGVDPSTPAVAGEPAVTGQWQIELVEAVTGAAAFDLVDYRTGALKIDDATGASDNSVWLAVRFRITNVGSGDQPSTLPANAFALVDPSGAPILDLATLTPPSPDAAGGYFPGGARDGWVAFDVPMELGPVLIRFQPYAATMPGQEQDPRYFSPGT